jgi:hypothetical protein
MVTDSPGAATTLISPFLIRLMSSSRLSPPANEKVTNNIRNDERMVLSLVTGRFFKFFIGLILKPDAFPEHEIQQFGPD